MVTSTLETASVRTGPADGDLVIPTPAHRAIRQFAASAVGMVRLLARGRLHHPRGRVGALVGFADGTTSRVYRETRVDSGIAIEPAVLVVGFVLRGVRGRAHAAFRLESWLNIPLFVGFPGFTSKLWMAHDEHGRYRGVYEWDDADQAMAYVHTLVWVLGLISVPGSIAARVLPGLHRDEMLTDPSLLGALCDGMGPWWRPVSSLDSARRGAPCWPAVLVVGGGAAVAS